MKIVSLCTLQAKKIAPEDWDYVNKMPNNLNGRSKEAENQRTTKRQLDRYSNFFSDTLQSYKLANRDIIISDFRNDFDIEFKRTKSISSKFFEVYEVFLTEKRNDYTESANSVTTIKRYEYNKKLLQEFETYRKKKIHFNQINKAFYNSFVKYCITIRDKKHSANTVRRNVGLFKTFLFWALENGHTYKTDFQKFKAPKGQQTDEVALTLKQVEEVFNHDFSKKH